MLLYIVQENGFPNKHRDVLQSFFKDYKSEVEQKSNIDKSDRYKVKTWEIQYGEGYRKQSKIQEMGLFNQLENMYVLNNLSQLQKKLDNKSINIYMRNTDNVYGDYETDYKNVDKQIADNYSKYYSKSFNIYEEYNLDKFFADENLSTYFIIVCDSEETAKQCIQEIKNLNAVIIISNHLNIVETEIKDEILNGTKNEYLFLYNGKMIENAREIMSRNEEYNDANNVYKKGTILYNYNQYIKTQINK